MPTIISAPPAQARGRVYDLLPSAASVSCRLTYNKVWDDLRDQLIREHEPIGRRVGWKIAARRGRDTDEYGSVAVEALVEAVTRMEAGEVILDQLDGGHGITRYLIKCMGGRCIHFLSEDAVIPMPLRVYRERADRFSYCEVDESIRVAITDCHDFLNDFVACFNVSEKEKQILLCVGRGMRVTEAAIACEVNQPTVTRLLEKIRRWVV